MVWDPLSSRKHQDKLVMRRSKRLLSYLFPVGVLGGLDAKAFFAAGDGDKSAMTRLESCGQTVHKQQKQTEREQKCPGNCSYQLFECHLSCVGSAASAIA